MRKAVLVPLLALVLLALGATSAQAALTIEEFETTASETHAGGHPDLVTRFKLNRGATNEVAKNITFEAPEGMFGNPRVLTQCSALDFALQQCTPNAQAGLITIHAEYEGNPNYLLGTAPIYTVEPSPEEAARFA